MRFRAFVIRKRMKFLFLNINRWEYLDRTSDEWIGSYTTHLGWARFWARNFPDLNKLAKRYGGEVHAVTIESVEEV